MLEHRLVELCLQADASNRPSAAQLLAHPFLSKEGGAHGRDVAAKQWIHDSLLAINAAQCQGVDFLS